ncbi:hypothetical protein [Novosphingobium malaysiense]|uniref:hypothetical protein n=1 Tax=Novosphingobium malaysiense TaxID=1348853 RepID=UPI000A5678AD|nr:hypothetical protein [Novosphingobium malaysiense]
MEKAIFAFKRHPSRAMADFEDYYVNRHAALGRTLLRCSSGYRVNITHAENGPDAYTEQWLHKVTDILDPLTAYGSMEDFEMVLADDRDLFAGFELYVVEREEEVVPGIAPPFVQGAMTPGGKTISAFADAVALPPVPAGARRVIDNHVCCKLGFTAAGLIERKSSEVAVFRMCWAEDGGSIEGPGAALVNEYRQLEEPAPGWHRVCIRAPESDAGAGQ